MKFNEAMTGRTAVHRATIAIVMIVAFAASCRSANEQSNNLFVRDDPQSVNHMTEVSQINIEADDDFSGIDSIAWDPASSVIAVLSTQGTNIQAYDTQSRMLRANFDPSEYGVSYGAPIFFIRKEIAAAGFTMDQSKGYRPALATWDLSTGKQVERLPRLMQESPALALRSSRLLNVSRDGRLIAASMQEIKSPELYGPASRETIRVIATQSGSEVRSISLPQIARVGHRPCHLRRMERGSRSGPCPEV